MEVKAAPLLPGLQRLFHPPVTARDGVESVSYPQRLISVSDDATHFLQAVSDRAPRLSFPRFI
jgi:hypothetical protein